MWFWTHARASSKFWVDGRKFFCTNSESLFESIVESWCFISSIYRLKRASRPRGEAAFGQYHGEVYTFYNSIRLYMHEGAYIDAARRSKCQHGDVTDRESLGVRQEGSDEMMRATRCDQYPSVRGGLLHRHGTAVYVDATQINRDKDFFSHKFNWNSKTSLKTTWFRF